MQTNSLEAVKLSPQQCAERLKIIVGDCRDIQFIPNPGNAGDALLITGAWHLFEKAGLRDRTSLATSGTERRAAVYIASGGGNLIPLYGDVRRQIERRLSHDFRAFILMPQTIRGHEDLLTRLDSRFHVFCRDATSFEHVRRVAPAVNLYLADDNAFCIDLNWIRSTPRRLGFTMKLLGRPRDLKRYIKWRLAISKIRARDGKLRLMRVDEEAVDASGAMPGMDLSAQYGSLFEYEGESELVTGDFLRVLEQAELIETDRLHVGIGASLLGKRVRLHDNNYGKNAGIFALSIEGRYPLTQFVR